MWKLQQTQIGLPDVLLRNQDNLYLLGERAGPTCLRLVTAVTQFNALAFTTSGQLATKAKGEWADIVQSLAHPLTEIEALIAQAQREVATAAAR